MELHVHGPVTMELFDSISQRAETIHVVEYDRWNLWRKELEDDKFLNFKLEDHDLSSYDLLCSAVDSVKLRLLEGYSLVTALSGGKDSNLVLLVFILACMELKREGKLDAIAPCGILHANTLIENPEAHNLAMDTIEEVVRFARNEGLPLEAIIASPTLQDSFFGRVLAGRGIPIFVNASTRDCATDWKIMAGVRAVNKWIRSLGFKDVRQFREKKLITLLGSRLGESVKRDASLKKQGSNATRIVRNKDNEGFLYPIYNFDVDRLWAVLVKAGASAQIPSPLENYDALFEFYSEGSGGDCELVAAPSESELATSDGMPTNANRGACSSRSGCILCTAVSNDRSTIQMIEGNYEKYGYLENLNRIQQALAKSQYNWNLRGGVGRTLYTNGYLELKHDTFSISFLTRLLHALISADYLEERRAAILANKLAAAQVPDTARNRRMAKPQFKHITPDIVIYLDFIWSLHGYSNEVFQAAYTWNRVYHYGELELFDDLESLNRSPTPRISKHYLKVAPDDGFWDQGTLVLDAPLRAREIGLHQEDVSENVDWDIEEAEEIDGMYLAIDAGLADEGTYCEQVTTNIYDPHSGSELSLLGTTSDTNSVDICTDNWELFVEQFLPKYRADVHITPLQACKSLLKLGLVQLPKGQLINRHYQALRGQTLYNNLLTSDRTVEQILNAADDGAYHVRLSKDIGMHSSSGKICVPVKRRNSKLPTSLKGANQSADQYVLF